MGPTGVGKTTLSIKLAKKFNGEIISGDSMQVYKHLDIGTAKVTPEEMDGVPHHLIDILPVEKKYNASAFQKQAKPLIEQINEKGKVPIIAGGTGLYIESLIFDVSHGGDTQKDEAFRKSQEKYAEENGNHALWEKLNQVDPKAAASIHENNVRRVVRALEVIEQTGELYSNQQQERTKENMVYDAYIIGLNTDRQLLYDRINLRVDLMMEDGLLDEVKWLDDTVGRSVQAARGIGYKEFYNYLDGNKNLESSVELVKKNSRNYAKRQLTWLNNRTPVTIWADLIQQQESEKYLIDNVEEFLNEGDD